MDNYGLYAPTDLRSPLGPHVLTGSTTSKPKLAVVGSFSVDSVLTPDGRYVTGKIGGNAVWSSLGAMISGNAPRVLSIVGTDYPEEVLGTLADAGIDVSAIVRLDREHPVRVTFAHLANGDRFQPVPAHLLEHLPIEVRRQFVDTTVTPEILRLGAPQGSDVPESWLSEVDAWHLPLLPLVRHRSLVEKLATARGKLHADCPARSDLLGDPLGRLTPTLSMLDVFLPSTSDFDVIAPHQPASVTVQELQQAGAKTVVLKAGGDGVHVYDGDAVWTVPAYSDAPLDPTGAGDTFCGGFLVGLAETGDLVEAAALGSAAASFGVATENPLTLTSIDPERTRARARELLARATRSEVLPLVEQSTERQR
jgi:sugar/nucleoside kinase (ribokinase family)